MAGHTPRSAQAGAMFGLDARIALAIFSIIAVIAGVAVAVNVDTTRAKSLASELTETGQALELYHHDLKEDIFRTLAVPSTKNAFQALFDREVLRDDGLSYRGRWNGPYIKFASTTNPRYGSMMVEKAGTNHTMGCAPDQICYLYIVYSQVKPGIVKEVNSILDGDDEADAALSGRVQWSQEEAATRILYYRAARALNIEME